MKQRRQTVALLAVGVLAMLIVHSPVGSDDKLDMNTPFPFLRRDLLEAPPGYEKGKAARKLMDKASYSGLQTLVHDEDDGIALYAAWRRLKIQMEARFLSADASATLVPIPDGMTREFIGFIEGRLHVPPPDGWRRVVRCARYIRGAGAYFPVLMRVAESIEIDEWDTTGETEEASSVRKSEQGRRAAPNLEIDWAATPPMLSFYGSNSRFEGDDLNVPMPVGVQELITQRKNALNGWMPEITGIASAAGPGFIPLNGRGIVAIQGSSPGHGGMVFCLKKKGRTAEIAWQEPMDDYWSRSIKGSEWFTELRVHRGNAYLFHGTHGSIGIEVFQLDSGKRLFSFNSLLPEVVRAFPEEDR